jgi:hypothetical protein
MPRKAKGRQASTSLQGQDKARDSQQPQSPAHPANPQHSPQQLLRPAQRTTQSSAADASSTFDIVARDGTTLQSSTCHHHLALSLTSACHPRDQPVLNTAQHHCRQHVTRSTCYPTCNLSPCAAPVVRCVHSVPTSSTVLPAPKGASAAPAL